MIKHLFWDLDDTIIRTQEFYDLVNLNTGNLVHSLIGVNDLLMKEIFDIQHDLDVLGCVKYGLSIERFPHSWEETYIHFINKYNLILNEKHIQDVRNEAKSIFEMVLPPYEGIYEVLNEVKSFGWEMNILTAGNDEVQTKRILEAGVEKYFDNVFIVPSKNPTIMTDILNGREPSHSVMIGNSLRSDIHPSLSNNMSAVHIARETWGYDKFDIDFQNSKYHRVLNANEIPSVLKKISEL